MIAATMTGDHFIWDGAEVLAAVLVPLILVEVFAHGAQLKEAGAMPRDAYFSVAPDLVGSSLFFVFYVLSLMPAPAFVQAVLAALAAALFALWLLSRFSGPWARRADEAQRFEVSRGMLLDAARSRFRTRPRIYVLPDGFTAWAGLRPGILLRRRYLDWMSRSEIEALIARGLSGRAAGRRLAATCGAAALCALVVVGFIEYFKVGTQGRWLALAMMVAAEVVALGCWLPSWWRAADLEAVRRTGQPEVFVSAIAEAARLNGSAPDMARIEAIAHHTGISRERLREVAELRLRPAEDRYPTAGDYVATGL